MALPPHKRRRVCYVDRRIGCLLNITGLPRVLVELCLEFVPLPARNIVDVDPNTVLIRARYAGGFPERALLAAADGGAVNVLFTNGTIYFPCEHPRQQIFLGLHAKQHEALVQFHTRLQERIPTEGERWRPPISNSGQLMVHLTRSGLDNLEQAGRLVDAQGHPITVDELEKATEFETAVVCFKAACFARQQCYLWKRLVFMRVKDKLDPNAWLTYL